VPEGFSLTYEIENHIQLVMSDDDGCGPGPTGGRPNVGGPRQLLAEGRFAAVERCGCGAIYLHLGPLSVRLDGAALPELKEVIDRAAHSLKFSCTTAFERGQRDDDERSGEEKGEGPGGQPVEGQSPPNKLN
jgi:hypothetical protein